MADVIKITITELDFHESDHEPVGAEMFYDPHFRHWVIYPVDADGNQLCEARYGFGKKEATEIKKEIETEIKNGTINRRWFYYD